MIPRRCVPVLASLLLTMSAVVSLSQPPRTSQPGPGLFRSHYNAAAEIRVDGTIQELVTQHSPGSPAGIHLLIKGTQGIVDAHLGPFVSTGTRAALRSGISIQVVGFMTEVNGKQYLLARQLIFEGRVVTVRSPHGFPVADTSGHASSVRRSSGSRANGGNQ